MSKFFKVADNWSIPGWIRHQNYPPGNPEILLSWLLEASELLSRAVDCPDTTSGLSWSVQQQQVFSHLYKETKWLHTIQYNTPVDALPILG